jgi:hypothetical protein
VSERPIIKMAKFEVVEVEEAPYARRWTIVEVVPGEKPVPVPFFGRRTEAEAEASKLNLYGRGGASAAKPVRRARAGARGKT